MNTKEKHPEGWRSVQNKKYPTEGSQDLTFSNWIVFTGARTGKIISRGIPETPGAHEVVRYETQTPGGQLHTPRPPGKSLSEGIE